MIIHYKLLFKVLIMCDVSHHTYYYTIDSPVEYTLLDVDMHVTSLVVFVILLAEYG